MIGYEDLLSYEALLEYAAPIAVADPRTVTLQAELATVPGVAGVTVVALPPSTADLYGIAGYGEYEHGYLGGPPITGDDEMRIFADGFLFRRAYDPEMP